MNWLLKIILVKIKCYMAKYYLSHFNEFLCITKFVNSYIIWKLVDEHWQIDKSISIKEIYRYKPIKLICRLEKI